MQLSYTATWYAVYCNYRKERQASAAIEQLLELTTYVPELHRRIHGQTEYTPLFPCYIFVRAHPRQSALSRVVTVPGVLKLVAFDGQAQPIPDTVIYSLHEQVDELNAHGGMLDHGFRAGEQLQLRNGPLRGLSVVFQGPMTAQLRVRVLIDFLGSLREMEVDARSLERTNTSLDRAPRPVSKRRTRGGGRKVAGNR